MGWAKAYYNRSTHFNTMHIALMNKIYRYIFVSVLSLLDLFCNCTFMFLVSTMSISCLRLVFYFLFFGVWWVGGLHLLLHLMGLYGVYCKIKLYTLFLATHLIIHIFCFPFFERNTVGEAPTVKCY
jgi:hypothetical protein